VNKKIGLGMLGCTIQGKMESEENIKKSIKLYSKRNKIAFIKFIINKDSATRILEFLNYYTQKKENGYAPCNYYNGALWPRFENEGSGCSSFGMALLDVANVLPPESKDWTVEVKVPMDLVGGEINNNKKIKLGAITRTRSWHDGTGEEDVDYINHRVFDPSIIYDWIIDKRNQNDSVFIATDENNIPGLIINCQNAVSDLNDPILKKRIDFDHFVRFYYNRNNLNIQKAI
jgi:hypothetical protein